MDEKQKAAYDKFVSDIMSTQHGNIGREDVEFLVNKYLDLRKQRIGHEEAVRVTYGCLYRNPLSEIEFAPEKRIAEIKSKK